MAMNYTPLPLEFLEEMEELSDAEYGRLIRWGQRYHLTGEEPKLSGNERFYVKRVKMQIDRYKENYDAKIEQRRAAGRESARKRSERALTSVDESQREGTETNNTETETKTETEDITPPAPPAREEDREAEELGRIMAYYMDNISKAVPSSVTTQSIRDFAAELGADIVLHAMELTAEAEAHDWRYTKAILERYRDSGLKTLDAVKEDEARTKNAKSGWRRTGKPEAAPRPPRDESKTMDQVRALHKRILGSAAGQEGGGA